MERQRTLDFPEPEPAPAPAAQTLEERFAHIDSADDRRLAEAVLKNRWNVRQLLQYMVYNTGSVSRAQQEKAARILRVMQKMIGRRQELFLGKAILHLQPRIRKTRMPTPHRITVGTLRRAGRHEPYAEPQDNA